MANKQRNRERGDAAFDHAMTAAKVISIGDMVTQASNKAVPASDYTYQGGSGGTYTSLALAQEAFVKDFLGVSREARRAADSETNLVIDQEGVFEFDCASATFEVGDLVGPAGDTSGSTYTLYNQKAVAVARKRLAIGRVWKRGTTVTTVLVKLFSQKLSRQDGKSYNVTFNVAAAEIANGNIITGFTPGHPFVLEALDAYVTSALTGSSKTVTINPEIDTVDVTGGVAVVASASAALGTRVGGTAPTALNTGTAASVIDIEASAVTAFTGGSIAITLRIRDIS